ncbi:enoyl-CoA hydratase/isomerase family protein [uncultured Jatrophihabitans sp.]|uniref:enoyl-CoA hydratase/isomerase family protein n=1 Tax=uncultured Jatrophihabitans sp. TaxID=1610747 RepID=UPI0035CA277D
MTSVLLCSERDGVATLVLNRPDKRNALDIDVFRALDDRLDDIAARVDEVGAVVVRGAGSCFSAGADISRPTKAPRHNFQASVIEKLATLPQPTVAAVHGHCVTGGLELALAADLIVASESARFADTHASFALVAGWGMTQRLPRRVGPHKAREMMFTARRYSGREAEAMGLASVCVPDAELDAAVDGLTATIVAGSWFSHREHKRVLVRTDGMTLAEGLADEAYRVPTRVGPDFRARAGGRFGLKREGTR